MGIGKSQPTRMGFFCSEGIQETLMISLMPMKSLPYPHPQAAETVNVFFLIWTCSQDVPTAPSVLKTLC